PVLQTESEGSAETVRTDATEGAESAEGAEIKQIKTASKKSASKSAKGVQAFAGVATAEELSPVETADVVPKTVDDLIKIIEKHTGATIRTGKSRQRSRGIFKVNPEVIRTKVRGDLPAIAHELGHYLDKKFKFSSSQGFKNELMKLGVPASKPGYSEIG